jgi:heat shock protein HslJ
MLRSIRCSMLLAALSACAAARPHAPSIDELRGTWQLAVAVPAGARIPTLTIGADGSLHGNGGVNRYNSAIDVPALARGSWQARACASTRMAGPPEAMALEQAFLQAIAQADNALLEGSILRLRRGDTALVELMRPTFR